MASYRHKARIAAVTAATALAASLATGGVASAHGAAALGHGPGVDRAGTAPVVEAYFADWDIYGRAFFPKDIPADQLNTVLYAFATPTADGTCSVGDAWADYQRPFAASESVDGVADDAADPAQHLFGNFNQIRKLKAAHPGLRVLMSIGGWSFSTYFSDVAATQQTRQRFVASCIDQFITGDLPGGGWPAQAGGPGSAAGVFDGIDVDWEYPGVDPGNGAHHTPADVHDATLLLQEFRSQLDAAGTRTGHRYLLTAALPAASGAAGEWELAPVSRTLDWANVMTYDFHGSWDAATDFDSPFTQDPRDPNTSDPTWNTLGTVRFYLRQGVPADKIAVGVPFYANQYLRTGTGHDGLYQSHDDSGLDPNTLQWDATPHPTYHDLVDVAGVVTPAGAAGGFSRHWDLRAGEPWLYSPAARHALASGSLTTPTVITYDDPASVSERAILVKALHLRGIFAWEISQDSDAHALTRAMSAPLR